MKKIIKEYLPNFVYFFKILRSRILLSMILTILVAILDGFGLTMFIPLIKLIDNNESGSLGNLQFLVDGMNAMGLSYKLTTVLLIMWLFFLIKGAIKYLSSVYKVRIQQFFIRTLRIKMLNELSETSFKYFVTSDVGRIQNTMTGEVDRLVTAFSTYFGTFEQAFMVMVYMGFAFFIDPQFAFLVILGGSVTNLLYKRIYKFTKKNSVKLTENSNSYQGLIIQHIVNFKYLKATAKLGFFENKLKNSIFKIENSRKKIDMLSSFLEASREPLLIGVIIVVILVKVYVLKNDISTILLSLMFFYRALSYLNIMQLSWNRFMGVTGSLANVESFQKELVKNKETDGTQELKSFKDEIALANVSFGYDADLNILKNIDLTIKKNECIAFVGESGSGKTTLVNMISGLLRPSEGTMKIDGCDLNDLKIESFQKRIGYITQDPVVFNDTIFNNVTFWEEPTEENYKKFNLAIERALLAEFMKGLKDNEQTVLGNNGINLSGGQKQRISIAREIYKDIEILILDEATSALDSETEKLIQENIDLLKGNYTLIMVAHRLSTIKNSDKIILMSNGRIVDSGNFTTLNGSNKIFRKMVDLQNIS